MVGTRSFFIFVTALATMSGVSSAQPLSAPLVWPPAAIVAQLVGVETTVPSSLMLSQ